MNKHYAENGSTQVNLQDRVTNLEQKLAGLGRLVG